MPLIETIGSGSARAFGLNSSGAFPFDISGIRTSNLQVALGPGGSSYKPGSSDWLDISGNNNHFKIVSGAYTIDSLTKTPYFNFQGSYGMAKTASGTDVPGWTDNSSATVITFTRIKYDVISNWRTLLRTRENSGTTNDATRHNVILANNGYTMGMYNNNSVYSTPSGFNDSGYDIRNIPGYGTSTWVMAIWRWANSGGQYYNFSYNNTPGTIRASINNQSALFMKGPSSIGGYHGGNTELLNPATGDQFWGDISNIFMWNARLSDQECLDVYNKYKGFYGL